MSCRIDIINSKCISNGERALFLNYEDNGNITYGILCGEDQVELHIRDIQKSNGDNIDDSHNSNFDDDDENDDTFSEITSEENKRDYDSSSVSCSILSKERSDQICENVEGVVVIFDVKNKASFLCTEKIVKEYKNSSPSPSHRRGGSNRGIPSCPIEVVLIAANIGASEENWEVAREEFIEFAEKYDIKDVYEVNDDLQESIFEILSEFGTNVYNKNKAFNELMGARRGTLNVRRMEDNDTISGQDMRRLMNAEAGDYSSFTDLESQALLPGGNRINMHTNPSNGTKFKSVINQYFGNGPFARIYPFVMIVFAALMSVAVYLDHGDQPTSNEIYRMKNQMKEFKWPFADPQKNMMPTSHTVGHAKPLLDTQSSSAPSLPQTVCNFIPVELSGAKTASSCGTELVHAQVDAVNGTWPKDFSWTLYKKYIDMNDTQSQDVSVHVTRDSFASTSGSTPPCDKFVAQMCLNGNYIAYASSSQASDKSELIICGDVVPPGSALEFKVGEGFKGCMEQGFMKSKLPGSAKSRKHMEVSKFQLVASSGSPAYESSLLKTTVGHTLGFIQSPGGEDEDDVKSPVSTEPVSNGGPHRIACVGDSYTIGQGATYHNMSYPSRLQKELGSKYFVRNYGVDGTTATILDDEALEEVKWDSTYMHQNYYQLSLDYLPNIVIIMFGVNDAKEDIWSSEDYGSGLETLVRSYQSLKSKPVVYVMIPPKIHTSYNSEKYGIQPAVIEDEIPKEVKRIAAGTDAHLIDLRDLFDMSKGLVSKDRVHCSDEGYKLMTEYILTHLKKSKLY